VTELGGTVQDLVVESGRAELVAEFAPDVDVRSVVEAMAEANPSTELRHKQEQARSGGGTPALRDTLSEELTDRQQSVLQAALHAGYFAWPRGSTAEELADSLDISSPTLHNHLRRAQQKLLEVALAEAADERPSADSE
jgi:predicted DNA binding protein